MHQEDRLTMMQLVAFVLPRSMSVFGANTEG